MVLPAPLGPMSPTISPSRTARPASSTAVRPPKRTVSPAQASTSRAASPSPSLGGRPRAAGALRARRPPPSRNTDRSRSSRSARSAAAPEKRTWPFSRKTARPARWRATVTDCSTRTVVSPPPDRWATTSRSSSTSAGARPSESSSMISRRGSGASAWARASICCCPPESSAAGWLARWRRMGKRSKTRSVAASQRSRSERNVHIDSRRFSATVSPGYTPRPPGAWAIPRRARASGAAPLTSRPSKVTVPFRAGVRPEMARTSVDFPAPLVPSRATTSPAATARSTPNSTCSDP